MEELWLAERDGPVGTGRGGRFDRISVSIVFNLASLPSGRMARHHGGGSSPSWVHGQPWTIGSGITEAERRDQREGDKPSAPVPPKLILTLVLLPRLLLFFSLVQCLSHRRDWEMAPGCRRSQLGRTGPHIEARAAR